MSASGKRKGDEDDVSEGDAPPSKTFKKDSDDTDEIVVCEVFLSLPFSFPHFLYRLYLSSFQTL